MKKLLNLYTLLPLAIVSSLTVLEFIYLSQVNEWGNEAIRILAAPASKPIADLAIERFKELFGVEALADYAASGTILAKLEVGVQADVVIFASSDLGEVAVARGLVVPESGVYLAYVLPALFVRADLSPVVKCIDDLAALDARIGVANPTVAPIGAEAYYIINQSTNRDKLLSKVVVQTRDAQELLVLLKFGGIDAAFLWHVYEGELRGVAKPIYPWECGYEFHVYSQVAYITVNSKNENLAREFIELLAKDSFIKDKLRELGYLTSISEVYDYVANHSSQASMHHYGNRALTSKRNNTAPYIKNQCWW